ncbi:hypothetical protein [Pedococcus sp. P5_B7]
MSRPLTGSLRQTTGGAWEASLPVRRGATQRVQHTFVNRADATAWLASACDQVNAGEPVTSPRPEQLSIQRVATTGGTSFRDMGEKWIAEHFETLWRGDVPRQRTVERHIARIADFMEERGLVMETMTRSHVLDLELSLMRPTVAATSVAVPSGLDPDALMTKKQLLNYKEECPSESTLKRRIKDGVLVPAARVEGADVFRVRDVFSEAVFGPTGHLRRGPKTQGVLSPDVAADAMWAFNAVFAHAKDLSVRVPEDRASLKMPRSPRNRKYRPVPVPLVVCVQIAQRLHVVHQFALWLMRILGVRIGEAYGIRVGDILDHGEGLPGVIALERQGGRRFEYRDEAGNVQVGDSSDQLKNTSSYRVVVAPPILMDLVRIVIAVFHTDSDGSIRHEARLIPGLERQDAGGQQGFRSALKAAAASVRNELGVDVPEVLDVSKVFSVTPHNMRRTILTELHLAGISDRAAQRIAGHVGGEAVLHRHYLLDDPQLQEEFKAAAVSERELRAAVGRGLTVPTSVRCTMGNQRALAADAVRIDTELVACGWLVLATDGDDYLLGASEVAVELGVSVGAARRWLASGYVPSVLEVRRARGSERRARLQDVLKVKDELSGRVTLRDLADELDRPYHAVYRFIRGGARELEPCGERDYLVPSGVATAVREHFKAQDDLRARAVPTSEAAVALGMQVPVLIHMITTGVLVEDDRAADGRRMVTKESLDAELSRRQVPGRRCDALVNWAQACSLLESPNAQMRAWAEGGQLEVRWKSRRRYVTQASLLRLMVECCPEKILAAAAEARQS